MLLVPLELLHSTPCNWNNRSLDPVCPWCLYHATFSTATFDEGLTQSRYRNGFVPTYASIILFASAQSGLLRIELNQLLQFLLF